MIKKEEKTRSLYAWGLWIERLKVWLQVCLLGYVIEKANNVDVSTRQHTDKRFAWLRPNYTQPWQQELRDSVQKNTHLHWIYPWGGKGWTDSNMHTDSISSSPIQTNTHIKAERKAETGRTQTSVRLTEYFIMFLLACQEHWRSVCVCICACICADLHSIHACWRFQFSVFVCVCLWLCVCGWEWQATVVIGCQSAAHWRECGQQLQSVHQGSVMRQGAGGSHDDFGRVAFSVQDWKIYIFLKSGKASLYQPIYTM